MKPPIMLAAWAVCFASSAQAQISNNVTLLGQFNDPSLPIAGDTRYNDVWGYVDCEGEEYAILGSAHYVHFFNLANPASPQLVGQFSGGATTVWRDIDTFRDRAYSVCDNCSEGLMIFDLSELPNTVVKTNQTTQFFSRAHTIYIDKDAGRLYVSGSNTKSNGVIILDLNADPDNPTQIGNPGLPGGYVHDIHVRNNKGYCSHGNSGYWVYNFSNPQNPVLLGTLTDYPQSGYNHSSWLSENGQYAVMADETHNKGLKMVNVSDPTDMTVTDIFRSALLAPADTASIGHNPYIRDNYAFVSYYHDGMQVFNISNPNNVVKVAWYDTYPANTNYSGFKGCWSVYPFLPSGKILASDMTNGLFILSLTNITLDPIPHPTFPDDWIQLTGDNPVCEGESVSLSVDPTATDVDWYLNGAPIPEQGNPVEVEDGGWYKATVYHEYCAVQTDSVELEVIPLPNPVITPLGNTVFCQGGSVILSVDPSATNVLWYRNGVLIQTGGYFLQALQAGMYHAILFNQSCQIQTNSVQVQIIPLPSTQMTLTGDNPVCEGESVTLSVDPTATNVDWYLNGQLSPLEGTQVEVTAPGLYHANVFHQFCSVQTNSILLQVIPLPDPEITPPGNTAICEGESVILAVDPSSASVAWYRNGVLIQAGGYLLEAHEAGTYYAILSNLFCQVQTNSVQVQVIPPPDPEIALSGDNPFCEGESVLLNADPTATVVEWYLNGVPLQAEGNPIEVEEAGWYYAVVYHQNCAIQSDSIEVQVITLPDPVITPLEDPVICEGESVILSADPSATAVEWYRNGELLQEEGPLLQVQEEGTYSAVVYNLFCSIQTNSVQVQVIPAPDPEIVLSGEPMFCEGESVLLSVDTAATDVEWYLDGQLLEGSEPQLEVQTAGAYYAILSNESCIIYTDPVEIEVIPYPDPAIALSGEASFCEGGSALLSVDPTATSVEWYLDGQLLEGSEPQLEVQTAGAYYAIVFNQSCSVQTEPVVIEVIPAPDPEIVLSGEASFCEGGSALLSADSTATVVEWYLDGQILGWTEPQIEVQTGGTYYAILSNEFCTIQTDSVEISVQAAPDPTLVYEDTLTCMGDSILLGANEMLDSWQWFLDGTLIEEATGPEWWAEATGEYYYTGTLGPCTVSSGPVSISILEPAVPLLSFVNDTLFATPAAAYQWFLNGELLEGATGPFLVPQESGAYTVLATDENGCEAVSDPVEVEIVNSVSTPLPQDWKVYPNPATDWLVVELPVHGGVYALHDLMGRTVATGMLAGKKTRIAVSHLRAGIYFMNIQSEGLRGRVKVILVPD